jgi:hypothetical protein
MPGLLELQRAFSAQLLSASARLDGESASGFEIYRETATSTLVNALRLSFPAVERLVGAEFFDGAARAFIPNHAPASAYLNDYGGEFADFLFKFSPAAAVPYLADVARLEFTVNRALHAPDRAALSLARLRALDESSLARVCFSVHPSVSLLQLGFPADAIWRAVLDQNDAAMAAIDLGCGPVRLLVGRDAGGVQVRRLDAAAFEFAARLFSGGPLHAAIEPASEVKSQAWLAQHLREGRLVDFQVASAADGATPV